MAVLILFVLVLAAAPNGVKAAAENATAEQDRNCRGYTRDGHQCSLPFIYKGVSYHTCTDVDNPPGRYWCSLTPDYDADKQWKRCAGIICDDCKVYATNGRRCVFPFVYKYKTYNYCTNADNGDTLWCAHSSVYNGQWGRCGDTLCGDCTVHTEWRHQCKFPFYYKGVWYEHCTMRDNPKPWCSLNGRSSQRGVDWDNCIANVCPGIPLSTEDTPVTSTTEQGSQEDVDYFGCFRRYDDDRNFILTGDQNITESVDACILWCRESNWKKAGMQGDMCSCGDDDHSGHRRCGTEWDNTCTCDASCSGNSNKTCGGLGTISLYATA